MFIDFYELFEIPPNANEEEIKMAYRKQSIKWHPDKNIDGDTTQRMQDINKAYLILKDKEAKKKYDAEYLKFKSFYKKTASNENETDLSEQKTEHKEKNYAYSDYKFTDEILEKWMQNAKKQAKQMAKDAIDEFEGASKEAANSITKYFLIIMIPMSLGFVIFKSCIN